MGVSICAALLRRSIHDILAATLERDCAVCKETFKLEAEDPDELVVVTLPCKHPFHEPCIIPWLKSSGTCPVCRYVLVGSTMLARFNGSVDSL